MADFVFKLAPSDQAQLEVDQSNDSLAFKIAPALDDAVAFVLAPFIRGDKGDKGDAGVGGGSGGPTQSLVGTAGAALGGHRIVGLSHTGTYTVVDNATRVDAFRAAGMTVGAAASGAEVTVQTLGVMTEPSWNWTPDLPVFLGSNGLPTQTVPTGAGVFVLPVGVALTSTSLYLQLRSPIFL